MCWLLWIHIKLENTGAREGPQKCKATKCFLQGRGKAPKPFRLHLCSGQALARLALRPARSRRITWAAGSVPSVSSSPSATDTMGWACTRVREFSLSKGCPRGAGSSGWRLVCERAGWPTSLGRSGGKAPWWCEQWCNVGPGKWSTSALFRGQPRRL